MSQNNILHSFTLTPASSKAIHAIPKKQKSRFVSRAILKYADDEPLNPRGQAHYMEEIRKWYVVIGKLNEHIIQLEAKPPITPPLEGPKERGFLHWLRQRRQARRSRQ